MTRIKDAWDATVEALKTFGTPRLGRWLAEAGGYMAWNGEDAILIQNRQGRPVAFIDPEGLARVRGDLVATIVRTLKGEHTPFSPCLRQCSKCGNWLDPELVRDGVCRFCKEEVET